MLKEPQVIAENRQSISYLVMMLFLILPVVPFPGSWLVLTGLLWAFVYLRFGIYRSCNDEVKKRRYRQIGIGYYVAMAFGILLIPFLALIPSGEFPISTSTLMLLMVSGAFYAVPAILWLAVVDHQKPT